MDFFLAHYIWVFHLQISRIIIIIMVKVFVSNHIVIIPILGKSIYQAYCDIQAHSAYWLIPYHYYMKGHCSEFRYILISESILRFLCYTVTRILKCIGSWWVNSDIKYDLLSNKRRSKFPTNGKIVIIINMIFSSHLPSSPLCVVHNLVRD